MIISDSFIYIRIPRTASSSIEDALKYSHKSEYDQICKIPEGRSLGKNNSWKLSHITSREFYQVNESIWNERIKFAFVRNPYDRIVSYYYYYREKLLRGMSFENFVEKYISGKIDLVVPYWCDQHVWVTDRKGNLMVDYIYKFENLKNDLKKICTLVGISTPKLPWHKKSKKKRFYKEYYNDRVEALIRKRCKKDFELFSYSTKL